MLGKRPSSVLFGVAFMITACGSSGPATMPEISGRPGQRPDIRLPSRHPAPDARVRVLTEGRGHAIAPGDVVVTNVDMRVWEGGRRYLDTWSTHQPTTVVLDGLHVSDTWRRALMGRRPGSRVVLVSPADRGFGPRGMPPSQVSPTDTLISVFDIVGGYPAGRQVTGGTRRPALGPSLPRIAIRAGDDPVITMPRAPAPAELTVRPLVIGTGPRARPGATAIVQYTGARWDNGQIFDSSYRRGGPTGFVLSRDTVVPGWLPALTGVRAGGRLLVVVPGTMASGFTFTLGGMGVPSGRTAVYVIDVLDVR